MCGTIALGSTSTILAKRLDSIGFYYPFFQTGLMFLGEASCSFLIFVMFKCQQDIQNQSSLVSQNDERKGCLIKSGKYLFCATAFFDFLGSFIEYYSYNLLKASAIVTFKMMVLIFLIIYRVLILKRSIYRHQKLGLIFLLTGFLLVGLEVCFNSEDQFKWNQYAIFAILLMIIAQFFNALVVIFQEYQMSRIPITPQEVITIQGLSGLIICSILYEPLKYLFDNKNIVKMQEPFDKMSDDGEVCILIAFLLFSIGLLNYFQTKTIKVMDSLSLSTVDSGRVILVWILAIAFSFESALPIEIVGGSSLIFGIAVYNEVIILPCCGMKKSARYSMRESQIYRELKVKDRDWQNKFDSILSK